MTERRPSALPKFSPVTDVSDPASLRPGWAASTIRPRRPFFFAGESNGVASGRLVNGRRADQMGTSNPGGNLTIEEINPSVGLSDLKVWLPDPANPRRSPSRPPASSGTRHFFAILPAVWIDPFHGWGPDQPEPSARLRGPAVAGPSLPERRAKPAPFRQRFRRRPSHGHRLRINGATRQRHGP